MSIASVSGSKPRFARFLAILRSRRMQWVALALLHAAATATLVLTERGAFALSLALLSWLCLNLFWLAILRRPAAAALISLGIVALTVALSRFKFEVTWMTATFMDVLIIDRDTVGFLLKTLPGLRTTLLACAIAFVLFLVFLWRLDPFRMRRRVASLGAAGCMTAIAGLSLSVPEQPWEPFQGNNHISSFVRSGILSVTQLTTLGWIDAERTADTGLPQGMAGDCAGVRVRPHIVLVLDESSFDVSGLPGMRVPAGYREHFRSYDGKFRTLAVEGTGGPTWYTEFNVLTGLSARSFGKLMFYVTRIAAGRVERGLPNALRRCGYNTVSLYPAPGSFLSARAFQHSAGVARMIDSREMRAGDVEPDRFYYDQALRILDRRRDDRPHFLFVYTVANHFPWDRRFAPELTPDWRDPGNGIEFDEYIRRQTMSAQDYREFVATLRRKYPREPFLIVRFGDHQPYISSKMIEPERDFADVSRSIMQRDPRYFRTYYTVDAVNFRPVDTGSAREELDAPYLPLAILEAAGLPLDATFAEQKAILQRCPHSFYDCRDGAEARRFNRLLIDAGLIR